MTFRTLLARLQSFAKDNPDHAALDSPVIVRLQTREDNGDDLHVGGLRSIAVDEGCTETFALTLDADQDPTEPDDDPIIDVLHRVLANRTGKLRVSDAYLICGIEPGKVNQDQISRFGRAIRELGWERQRKRFGESLQYAYVSGTAVEREAELVIDGTDHLLKVAL
jgi:hypothetical protein